MRLRRLWPLWALLSCDGKGGELSSIPYQPNAKPWYQDADGDGYGNPGASKPLEVAESGYVENAEDCDDQNFDVHPGASERCTPGDEDCDGLHDEADPELVPDRTFWADPDGDSLGDPGTPRLACSMPEGYADNDDDCSPEPASVDWVDGTDDDCDGLLDVQGDTFGTWWAAPTPIWRSITVGDTTLWLISDAFTFDGQELDAAQVFVLRAEDVDFEATQLVFDEALALGSYGDIARDGEYVWMRFDDSLHRIDPTIRGLSPAISEQSAENFTGFPLSAGDFDGDGEVEIASGPLLTRYDIPPAAIGGDLTVEETFLAEVFYVDAVSLGAEGEAILFDLGSEIWYLPPAPWTLPQVLYTYPSLSFGIGDLNGDSRDDVVVCAFNELHLWLGEQLSADGPGAPTLTIEDSCQDVAVADVTGDGIDDLWVASQSEARLFPGSTVLPQSFGPGDAIFVLAGDFAELEATDIDQDGYADLGARTGAGWRWLSGER